VVNEMDGRLVREPETQRNRADGDERSRVMSGSTLPAAPMARVGKNGLNWSGEEATRLRSASLARSLEACHVAVQATRVLRGNTRESQRPPG
jgi:hypothetical protein